MVVIGLTSWEGTARFVRAEILSLREQEFIHASQASGARGRRIIARHLVPNALGPVLVSATLGVAGAILTESSLSFLGFGVPPPDATWGNILADGKRYIFDAPWLTLIPGTAILRGRARVQPLRRGPARGLQSPPPRALTPLLDKARGRPARYALRRSGGTGRRARLRGVWGNPWGFESPLRHHFPPAGVTGLRIGAPHGFRDGPAVGPVA